MAILVALDDAEHALLGDHLGAVGAGSRLAGFRRHLIDALLLGPACAKRAERVRHAPDAVLVRHQDVVAPPGEAIGPVEVLDVAIDPSGAPLAFVAQEREVARTLL